MHNNNTNGSKLPIDALVITLIGRPASPVTLRAQRPAAVRGQNTRHQNEQREEPPERAGISGEPRNQNGDV